MGSPSNVITITVKCDLDLDEIFGRVHVYTSQEKSMDWVLDEFCREKNVRRVSTFALRSGLGQDYDLTKTINQCGLGDGDLIYCYNKNPPKPKPPPKSRQRDGGICGLYCVLAICFLLIALAGIIAVILVYEYSNYNMRAYAVVVDAGSTSSKIYLYSWPTSLIFNTGKVDQMHYYKESKAVSSFIDHPSQAAAPIVQAIKKEIIDKKLIPAAQINSTPLYLGATAGMRMMKDRKSSSVNALFQELRKKLAGLTLSIANPEKQVRIISGTEEGVDAWVTVNYLEGTLGKLIENTLKPASGETLGSLDLGGASTQISFVPKAADVATNATGMTPMELYGRKYNVYSHSFLCYGKSQAQNRLLAILAQDQNYTELTLNNPCTPSGWRRKARARDFLMVPCSRGKHAINSYGYEFEVPSWVKPETEYEFVGTSSYASCKDIADQLFKKGPCPYPFCSINSVYQPKVSGKFKAFAGYYHVAKRFNATETEDRSKATMEQFEKAVKTYCTKDWNTIKRENDASIYSAQSCFDGIYVQKLLNSYGFDNNTWSSIDFVRTIAGSTVGWSLGFMILESGRIKVESFLSISLPLFIGLLILFILILIMAVILFVVAWRNRKSRSRYNANLGSDTTGYGSI